MTTAWKSATTNPFPDTCLQLPEPSSYAEWLRNRRDGIGSSDCSAIMGLSNWESPYSLWLDKRGELPLDIDNDNEYAQWGHLLEPVIREETGRRLGLEPHTCGALANIERPWQRCNLDGYFPTDDGTPILETKNTSWRMAHQWADQIPDAAELQVIHSMAVTGATHAYVAGLIGGNQLVIHRIERNETLINIVIDAEEAFWRHVQDGTEPDVDGHVRTMEILTKEWAHHDGAQEVDPTEVEDHWQVWHQADLDETDAKQRKKEALAQITRLMDGHDKLVSGKRVWAAAQRTQLSMKRLEADHPELVEQYTRPSPVFDRDSFKQDHPNLFTQYQGVSIRPKTPKTDKEN